MKRVLMLIGIILFGISLFGCNGKRGMEGNLTNDSKTMNITDFDGMRDLPRNPSKIVFGTNSNTYNEETGWGEPIEYEVKKEKITETTEKLFTVPYKALPKYFSPNDMSEIWHYLFFMMIKEIHG